MTDTKLQELIETLKKRGVESGEEESRQIIDQAKSKADGIISKAKTDADSIISSAKKEADNSFKQLQSSMEIAASQLMTDLKRAIEENMLTLPMKNKISDQLSDTKFLKELLITCVREYVKRPESSDLSILLPKDQQEKLGDFATQLVKELPGKKEDDNLRIDLKSDGVSFGFIIGTKDGVVRLDFTEEAFLELFLKYLSPRFRGYFKKVEVKGFAEK